MNQFWQIWPGVISDDVINGIINTANKYPLQDAGMGFDGSTKIENHRNSQVRWINPFIESDITRIIETHAKIANKAAFGFNIDFISDIQYTEYSKGNFYSWHEDTFWDVPNEYHRKLTFILQLSDSTEYVGGNIELDPQFPQPDTNSLRQKGTILIFPSFIRHRACEVVVGNRKSLVSWIEGPKFR